MYQVIILGAGGFAKEVYDWCNMSFNKSKYKIKGFLLKDPSDVRHITKYMSIINSKEDEYEIKKSDRFILAIGDIEIKKKVVRNIKDKGGIFISLIHHSAIISSNVKIGEGVIICPNVVVSSNSNIGDFSMLNFNSSVAHDSSVGKHSILCPYATINGYSSIGDEVYLGSHSSVSPNITVGSKSKINANSVAMKNIPPGSFVIGVPGKIHHNFFK